MKRNLLHTIWVAAAVLLAASCEQEELPGVGADGTQTLAITVTDGGYAPADRDGGSPAGVPQTRAVENGYITKFTAGDACGLYIVRGGELAYANVKLTATAATDGTLTWQPEAGVTLTDDLGGYVFNGTTLYPLRYVEGSARLFTNGAPQPAPTAAAGPPLRFTGVSVPAGGDAVVVYQAQVSDLADPGQEGTVVNTVTAAGSGLAGPATAAATVNAAAAPALAIAKSICPTQVRDNDRVSYTFVITNSGNTPVTAGDGAVVTDVFDPILGDLAVSFNGAAWTPGQGYTYNQQTGAFSTAPGSITVPAASYTRDPVTGAYTVTPGRSTLRVEGTI